MKRAQQAGAMGFVVKEAGPAQRLEAITRVAAGETYLPPSLEDRMEAAASRQTLSARETQVLRLMVEGLGNKEVAARASLTAGTVRVYVCHILAKMEVSNRAEAIFEAVKRGMIIAQRWSHPGADSRAKPPRFSINAKVCGTSFAQSGLERDGRKIQIAVVVEIKRNRAKRPGHPPERAFHKFGPALAARPTASAMTAPTVMVFRCAMGAIERPRWTHA